MAGRGGLGWKEQRRQTKHTAPALSQVLYFPEVMAKGGGGVGWGGMGRKTEKARESEEVGGEGTVNHCSMKSQEASAQGKKESWRIVRGCGKHLDFLLCRSPWGGERLPPLPLH